MASGNSLRLRQYVFQLTVILVHSMYAVIPNSAAMEMGAGARAGANRAARSDKSDSQVSSPSDETNGMEIRAVEEERKEKKKNKNCK